MSMVRKLSAAQSNGRSPQAYCDEITAGFVALWQQNIQYDRFSRTTASNHEAIVKEFFQRVWTLAISTRVNNRVGTASPAKNLKKSELLEGHRCAIHTNKQAE